MKGLPSECLVCGGRIGWSLDEHLQSKRHRYAITRRKRAATHPSKEETVVEP